MLFERDRSDVRPIERERNHAFPLCWTGPLCPTVWTSAFLLLGELAQLFNHEQVLAWRPTIRTAAKLSPVHFDLTESSCDSLARLISIRDRRFSHDDFVTLDNRSALLVWRKLRIEERQRITIGTSYETIRTTEGPRFGIKDALIWPRFDCQCEFTLDRIGRYFADVVTGDIESTCHWLICLAARKRTASSAGERGRYRAAHNLLSEFVGFAHSARLKTGESGVGEQNQKADEFNRSIPRFLFDSVAKVLYISARLIGVALCVALAIGCAGYGLSVIHEDIPRKPDQAAAWRTLWLAIAIIGLGQASIFLAFYLMGLW